MKLEKTESENQVQLTLPFIAQRLQQREVEIDDLVKSAVTTGVRGIMKAFEQGDDLLLAKAQCNHGEFQDWLKDNFPKCYVTATKYMKLAQIPKVKRDEFLHEVKSLRHALMVIGVVPEIQQQELIDVPRIAIPPEVQKLTWIAEWCQRDGEKILTYTPNQRKELKTKLRPVVEIYEKL